MTLINYVTRIHFADGVLEEALRSEMERMERRRPLVVAEEAHVAGGIGERLFSSFPLRARITAFSDVPPFVTEAAADSVAALYRREGCDLVVAFGGNSAIGLAKAARIAVARNVPVSRLLGGTGGMQGSECGQPELIAIPNVSGFSSAVSDHARLRLACGELMLLSARRMIPTVAICDPTVTLGSPETAGASAAVCAISRGADTYLARGFNPPADGLALDGLTRVVDNADAALKRDELPARREMMAGSLSSALSLQKGLCAVHAIVSALASVTESRIDLGAASRLILPELVRSYGDAVDGRSEALKRSLGIRGDIDLSAGLADILRPLPLPDSLSRMGVARHRLGEAAARASSDRAIRYGARQVSRPEILSILESVY